MKQPHTRSAIPPAATSSTSGTLPPALHALPARFAALGVAGDTLAAVAALGFTEPTPIQEQAIPPALAGRDVVGCAQTGTGKTAAFLLPLLQRMQGRDARSVADAGACAPVSLIVTPTRELAAQIEAVATALAGGTRRRVLAVFGGVPYPSQAQRARRGADLLVATPGRLLDMQRRGDASLDRVETVVLDEADRMLDMGFWPDVRLILQSLPARRQSLLFSATMSKDLLALVEDTLHDPLFVEVCRRATPVDSVRQVALPVSSDQKIGLLMHYIRHHDPDSTLVFTRTKHRADRLARALNREGVSCAAIHGDRSQSQRSRALHGFRMRNIRLLVATDVVARGIDVDGITHVINFDVPQCPEDYVHRIGRTARAGAGGTAVTLVTTDDAGSLAAIETLTGTALERAGVPGFAHPGGVFTAPSATAHPASRPRRRRRSGTSRDGRR